MTDGGGYAIDRAYGDTLIPRAVQLIAPHIIVPADARRDRCEATDLVIVNADKCIAFRTRRTKTEPAYPDEFTLRYSRPSGSTTEFEKVMKGFGDWMFYGWDKGGDFVRWLLLDLAVFRRRLKRLPELVQPIANRDGTQFVAFDINKFSSSLIIDQGTTYDSTT